MPVCHLGIHITFKSAYFWTIFIQDSLSPGKAFLYFRFY